ncbi:DNA (cytosine-5-)-methyltransferase [Enterococcus sp. N342-3-1-2]
MLNVVETFSGIGSQTQALRNIGVPHRISATSEWEISALFAYDILHHGNQDLSPYRHHTRDSLAQKLSQFGLSTSGKDPLTYQSLSTMNMIQLKSILCAIERSNNLGNITQIHAEDLEESIDLLTYSFPCQDLSVSSHWWHNKSGIEKGSGNRSSLLWEVERILGELVQQERALPKFLLMENVSAILNQNHIGNFNEWRNFLSGIGYVNQTYTLNANDFGIPQRRERTYMLSVLTSNKEDALEVEKYFFENNLENYKRKLDSNTPLDKYLKLDYSNPVYRNEAIESTPKFTPSRMKIYQQNVVLAHDDSVCERVVARTITTKQDRHPNSGIITYSDDKQLVPGSKYRNITSREAFLLMGFTENQYNLLIEANIKVTNDRSMIAPSKMLKLCGNSIVVNVLEAIFKQMIEIKNNVLDSKLESV